MDALTKILIVPYFGELPDWIQKYEPPTGYSFMLDTNFPKFKRRVKEKLGLDYPGEFGSGKVWDYRPALGILYEEEIEGYHFFGHTDLDCVYGDVSKWATDEFLSELDVHSNHHSYVNGSWTLYRNKSVVKNLFREYPFWGEQMASPDPNGWAENEYSRLLERSGLRYKYTFWQGWPYTTTPNLVKQDGKLYQDGEEIMMFHFRRSKKWPL